MPANTPENRVAQEILLATRHLVAWMRNNTGLATYKNCKVWYGIGGRGGADYIGIIRRTGKFICCEVKAPGKVATPEQERFIADVIAAGGIGVVAYGPEDVLRVLEGDADGRARK